MISPNHDSPVPLYHQIAESLRYRIAVGALEPGAPLPPVRDAAGQWGVNLHTVRKAYAELTALGLAETRRAQGTFVRHCATKQRPASAQRLSAFLDRVAHDARKRFGVSPEKLGEIFGQWGRVRETPADRVFLIECSLTQCVDLARQLEAAWRVNVEPWPLDRPDEPLPGVIVGTFFHYNDVRRRWPHRLAEVRFVAIRPDPNLACRVRRRIGDRFSEVILCEREATMAADIAADLSVIFSESQHRVIPLVTDDPADALREESGSPVLFSPRVWGGLDPALRAHPRAFEARYVLDADGLDALAHSLGWSKASDLLLEKEEVA